jgi:hypothetical protein
MIALLSASSLCLAMPQTASAAAPPLHQHLVRKAADTSAERFGRTAAVATGGALGGAAGGKIGFQVGLMIGGPVGAGLGLAFGTLMGSIFGTFAAEEAFIRPRTSR